MSDRQQVVIGLMDPNSFSFRAAIEGLLNHINKNITYKGKDYEVVSRRIVSRPYDVLKAKTSCSVILNRGAHWNPHHNSFFHLVMPHSYMINDMVSFKSIDKNTSYGHMAELGMKIPRTWAIPQADYSELLKSDKVEPDLIFPDYEMFDLASIGEEVGYPAFMKPQDGGGWVDVEKVNNVHELHEAYHKIKDKPVNLQEAVDYQEFVRVVGVGPQMMPMHYNASAEFSHDRYLRGPGMAVEHNFIPPEQYDEVCKITKIINAFYNWDHNSCEILVDKEGEAHPIDFANAYPDSNVTSLHFYFPDLVKAMARWLLFIAVSGRKKPLFAQYWERMHQIKEQADQKGWSYKQTLDAYAELADEAFQTKEFNEFCATAIPNFDAEALEYFSSEDFDGIVSESVERYFKFPHEWPAKKMHYRGIHQFWLHCEQNRLGSGESAGHTASAEGASNESDKAEAVAVGSKSEAASKSDGEKSDKKKKKKGKGKK